MKAKDKSESVFAWYVFNDHTLKVELKNTFDRWL